MSENQLYETRDDGLRYNIFDGTIHPDDFVDTQITTTDTFNQDINIDEIGRYTDSTTFDNIDSNTFNTTKAEEAANNNDNKNNNKSGKTTSFGRRGTRRRGGVLRYPLEMMTDHTDYLQIDIKKYVPLGNYVSRPGDSRRYVTGNNFTDQIIRQGSYVDRSSVGP